jgi:predicted nucleotidyltransferase component of viral defense system
MIPRATITFWSGRAPWPSPDQVEQDLILSRLIIEIAGDPLLRDELVFRGGTCLHKLHLPEPLRYSEDLDYVRVTSGPIGAVLDALRSVATKVGMETRTDIGPFPKVYLRHQFESGGGRMRIKVEINTYETAPARPCIHLPYAVESPWWSGSASILTFEPAELMATKLRALYQRRKGRDLFDLWLALTRMNLDPGEILACLPTYRPRGYTSANAIANLRSHLGDPLFRNDLRDLVIGVGDYDIDAAGELVIDKLLVSVN